MSNNVANVLTVNQLRIYQWHKESIVYNSESGDMHLFLSFNAELLILMLKQVDKVRIILKVSENYQVDKQQAELLLDNLYLEYKTLNLID